MIPQLLVLKESKDITLLAIKIVDDVLMTETNYVLQKYVIFFNSHFRLGEIIHGPYVLRFYEMNITQNIDYTVSIHADDKLSALEQCPISRTRRYQIDEKINDIVYVNLRINCLVGNHCQFSMFLLLKLFTAKEFQLSGFCFVKPVLCT